MILTSPTAIVLDESPLSLLTQRTGHDKGDECKNWYGRLVTFGHRFYVPEIADYELRRELIRIGKRTGDVTTIRRLDELNAVEVGRFLPVTTSDIRQAAEFWAQLRAHGRGGADPKALDADVLIAAQGIALESMLTGRYMVIVATENARHFETIPNINAAVWSEIEVGSR